MKQRYKRPLRSAARSILLACPMLLMGHGLWASPPSCNLFATPSVTQPSCHNSSNGSIDVTVISGVAPFTYLWNTGATTEDLTGVPAGTYTLTITDAANCTFVCSATVGAPAPVTATATSANASTCLGADGWIDITPQGGTPPYTYNWSNGATTQDVSNLAQGTYTLTITDANGCFNAIPYSFTILRGPLQATASASNPSSCSANDGAISVSPFGGTPPFSYNWSNGAGTAAINNLAPGSYYVNISDATGCSGGPLYFNILQGSLNLSAVKTNISCNSAQNGSIDLSVSGGTAPYTYSWSNGATTQDLNSLSPGTYTASVTDANGCTGTYTTTITQPTPICIFPIINHPTGCNNNNGYIDITPSCGVLPYTYSWSNGATTQDISGLAGGTYAVTVTDGNGCTLTQSFTLQQTASFNLSANTTQVSCYNGNNGAIDLSVTGGSGPFSYSWSNGATTQDISNLQAGTYTVTVTGPGNCSKSASYTISQPAAGLHLSASIQHAACYNSSTGAINLSVSGGTAPYTYNWGGGVQTEDRTSLTAGSYTVTVTDAKGCTKTATYTVGQPSAISLSANTTNPTCGGGGAGSIDLSVSGGTAPYTYSWSNGATTQDISGLAGGTYTVTVTDQKGCTKTASYTLNQGSNNINVSISGSPVYTVTTCNQYTIYLGYGPQSITLTANASGGTPPYTYSWSPATGLGSPNAASTTASPTATTTYYVTVTDANGCSKTSTTGFTVKVKDVRCGNNHQNHKVAVCHIPPGNPSNPQAICVSVNAVPAHLAHGDCLGDCTPGNGFNRSMGTASEAMDAGPEHVTLYPNPAQGMINISWNSEQGAFSAYQVLDVNGRVVAASQLESPVSRGEISLNLSGYVPGVYMIRLVGDHGNSMHKFVVQ